MLSCVEMLDEDGIRVQTFTDQQGRTVLERRGSTGDTSDTYYVYNDLSQLVYVLTPEYQQNASTSLYAYCYEYNARGLISSRKLPGCQVVTMEYDTAVRLIRMQDGLLRASSQYRVYTYDGLSRQVSQSIEGGNTELINYYDKYDFLTQYSSLAHEGQNGSVFGLDGSTGSYAKGNLTGVWQKASDGTALLTTYVYDDHNRIVKQAESGLDGTAVVTKYTYNHVGDDTSETSTRYHYVQSTGRWVSDYELDTQTEYEHRGTRLASTTTVNLTDNTGGAGAGEIVSTPGYDDYGRVTSLNRSGTSGDVNYTYDLVHGWLTGISYPSGGFTQTLYRETGGNRPRWNGSISAMTWQTESGVQRRYDYRYDNRNRLTEAAYSHYGSQGSSSSTLSLIPASTSTPNYSTWHGYDWNSNLKWVKRYGKKNDGTYNVIDKLKIDHPGNQLLTVKDSITGSLTYTFSSEFVDGSNTGSEYSYNGNGGLTKDLNRGISGIVYDKLGHPTQVTFTSGNTISYVYAADGRKLSAVHRQGTHQPVTTDYAGPYEFTGGTISRVSFPGGYYSYSPNSWTAHYYIQDYQGSNRKVVKVTSTTVEQVTHYYPYGGVIGDISTQESTQKYKFEGKELDRSFGLDNYDIHARNYFAMLPMWDRVDPLAEKYFGTSPYAYCGGDPVNKGDYDGRETRIYIETNGVGHTFITTGEGVSTTVFSYGRYGGLGKDKSSARASTPIGEGVLLKLQGEEALQYINKEIGKGAAIFGLSEVDETKIEDYFNKRFEESSDKPTEGQYKNSESARVIDKYNILSNNCTTTVMSAIESTGANTAEYWSFSPSILKTNLDLVSMFQNVEKFLTGKNSSIYNIAPTDIKKEYEK